MMMMMTMMKIVVEQFRMNRLIMIISTRRLISTMLVVSNIIH